MKPGIYHSLHTHTHSTAQAYLVVALVTLVDDSWEVKGKSVDIDCDNLRLLARCVTSDHTLLPVLVSFAAQLIAILVRVTLS